jgi:hypothetical protein
MDVEARALALGNVLDHTPSATRTGGQVVQVGALAGIIQEAAGLAASEQGSILVEGLVGIRAAAVAGEAGDPVGWDENGTGVDGNTGALTVDPSTWDFCVGSLAKDLAATDGIAEVLLNKFSPDKPYWPGKTWETKADNYTVDAQDSGKVLCIATDAKAFTLPATAAGLEVIFVNTGLSGAVALTISPNASDKIMGPDIAGTDDKDQVNTKATAKRWDYMHLVADGSAGWYIKAMRGVWAEEAA